MADVVRPGQVDWTGDNPFIYLKESPGGDWSSLSLFFRVTASELGAGHMALVIQDPYGEADSGAVRLALTDNGPLAGFLLDDFVRRFVLFRPSRVLDHLEVLEGANFSQHIDGDGSWTESAHVPGADRSVVLRWADLGEPFAVDVPPAQSGTGEHEMFSVFRTAGSASVTVDGERLPGSTVERDFLNGPAQSAALALSETWVRG